MASERGRVLIALAGPPASGKSTLAETLHSKIAQKAAVLPMDGFHLDNARLVEMGLLHRKGAPETFGADGFVALVHKLRAGRTTPYPTFDRAADRTVPGGGEISADTQVVLIEGNYLLLKDAPWSDLAAMFDLSIRLDVPSDVLLDRLVGRWLHHGLSREAAQARAMDNDMQNAAYVAAHSSAADVVLRLDAE